MLSDNSRIRDERKKAKENRAKYTGVSSSESRYGFSGSSGGGYSGSSGGGYSGSSGSGFGNTGKKYGGFSSESYHSRSGSAGAGGSSSRFRDEDSDSSPSRAASSNTADTKKIQIVLKGGSGAGTSTAAKAADVPNLLDMESSITSSVGAPSTQVDDEWGDFTSPAASAPAPAKKASPLDDFADFQSSVPAVSGILTHGSF